MAKKAKGQAPREQMELKLKGITWFGIKLKWGNIGRNIFESAC